MSRLVEWIGAVLLILLHLALAVLGFVIGAVVFFVTVAFIVAPFVWLLSRCFGGAS